MNAINLINFTMSVIITFLSYCIVPIILRLIKGKIEYKKGHKIIIINCSIIWVIFRIISIELGLGTESAIVVVLYYFINKAILLEPKIEYDEDNKDNITNDTIPTEKICLSAENKNEEKGSYNIYGDDIKLQEPDENIKIDKSVERINTEVEKASNQQKEIIKTNNNNTLYAIIVILVVTSIILAIYTFSNLNYYKKKLNKAETKLEELEAEVFDKKSDITILEDHIESLEKSEEEYRKYLEKCTKYEEKIEFYDDNIVFVIDGYGKYYYTYDQMEKVTQGIDEFSYWAYNKEQAKDLGYKKWK